MLLAKLHQVSSRILNQKIKKSKLQELNSGQGRILFVLLKADNISIQQLSQATLLEKSTLTSMLARLEKQGYIKRVADKKDRRKILLRLTDKKKYLEISFRKISQDMTKIFYAGFSEQDKNIFEEYLKKILKNLTTTEKKIKNNKVNK